MTRLLVTILLAAASVWVCTPIPTSATEEQPESRTGLSVSPAIFELAVEPGEVQKRTFSIRNITDAPVPVSADVERLAPVEEEIDIALSANFDASAWIKLSEQHHILDVKERRNITATIRVPKEAEPGGHYATILLNPLTPAVTNDLTGTKAAARVGVLVLITVKGDAVHELSLPESPIISRLQMSQHIPIGVDIANTGTVHEVPAAKVTVRNLFGFIKAELPIKPRIVLPNTIKEFSTEWDGPFLFGIYSAQVEGSYSSNQTSLTSSKKYFVVIQWLPAILFLLVLPGIIIFTRKTYKRWPAAYRAFKGKTPIHRPKDLASRRKRKAKSLR